MLKKITLMMVIIIGLYGCAAKPDASQSAQAAEALATVCAKGDLSLGQPNGCYLMGGSLSLKFSAPKILSASIATPHMELFGGRAVFVGPSGMADNFVLILPSSSALNLPAELRGTWTMSTKPKSKAFTVELAGLADLLDTGLNVKITKRIFSGTVLSNGNIKGTINFAANVPKIASLSISSTAYTGVPTNAESAAAAANKVVADQVYNLDQFIGLLPLPIQQLLQGEAVPGNNIP
ncbi:MAG: hypothetical protein NTV43_09125 [Methylococcales bacterium]|nr:hypothetical protein [Methylococcales bacterium]